MNQTEQEIGRRNMHWLAYVSPIASHLIALAVQFYLMSLLNKYPKFIFLELPLAIAILLTIARLVYIILYKRTFTYVLTSQRVRTESGLLPWQKKMTYLTLDNIFEAYTRQGMNEKMFNYGDITLIKKDGLRSEYILAYIPDPLSFLSQINSEKERPAYIQPQPVVTPQPPVSILPVPGQSASTAFQITEQLEKLIQLKRDGNITEEEFEKLKFKLIQAI